MTVVASGNTTVGFIRRLVRELTASPGEQQLSTQYLDETLNNVYGNDFPYAIKLDQMRSVYEFYTQPYIDRYPLDVNYNQGVRGPMYVDGVLGYFGKDRQEYFAMWPKWPSLFNQFGSNSLQGGITLVSQANPALVTSANHGLTTGQTVYIYNITGMIELNNASHTVTVVNTDQFSLGVDSSLYSAYVSGGTWNLTPVTFGFTIPGPIISKEVVIGGSDVNGNPITISDDGKGNLQLITSNPVVSIPPQTTNPSLPGMYNVNTQNPGLNNVVNVGAVNYVTGVVAFTNPLPLLPGTTLTVRASQYQPGRPYSLLFWNNEFTIRPIPKHVHKVTIETYLTPVQFMESTDNPILNQWAFYLGYLTAAEILRRRQDLAGLAAVMEGVKRQEALVLERQGTEEINQRNATIFSSSTPGQGNQYGSQGWGGY
jgi:hypothetical protein